MTVQEPAQPKLPSAEERRTFLRGTGAARFASLDKTLLRDLVERLAVLLLFGLFLDRMLGGLRQLVDVQIAHPEAIAELAWMNAQVVLLVISEALGVVLILARRRSASLSAHPLDWSLVFLAVSLPLLVRPAAAGTWVPAALAAALMLAGLLLQIAAKIALWRSFGLLPANRGIRTGGPYRLLRHPMYAGYMLTHIGFLLGYPSWQNTVLYAATFAIQIARMLREEAMLRGDPRFVRYAEAVQHRLVPKIF